MIELITALSILITVFVFTLLINRNLVYLIAIILILIVTGILDYTDLNNRYLAILSLIILLILGVRFYEHYRE
jgi:cell division protein FtsW (lipid II flippase)